VTHTLHIIGKPGQRTCYLDIAQWDAINFWKRENAGEEPTADMIRWIEFETAFGASEVWSDRE
jgi:hypothetical protein